LDEWIGNTLLVNFFLAVEALTTWAHNIHFYLLVWADAAGGRLKALNFLSIAISICKLSCSQCLRRTISRTVSGTISWNTFVKIDTCHILVSNITNPIKGNLGCFRNMLLVQLAKTQILNHETFRAASHCSHLLRINRLWSSSSVIWIFLSTRVLNGTLVS
jgi:hypothetical protein